MPLSGSFVFLRHAEQVLIINGGISGQVLSVDMLEEQALAYKQAVTEYRALAMAARASKTSKATSTNILDCLARRQVSNIFTQLRKVCAYGVVHSLTLALEKEIVDFRAVYIV